MGPWRFTPEQIIAKLREVEVLVARGASAVEACRQIGIAEQTLYRWRKQDGGLKVDQARLTADIIALAKEHGRYRYRRIHALLGRAGWQRDCGSADMADSFRAVGSKPTLISLRPLSTSHHGIFSDLAVTVDLEDRGIDHGIFHVRLVGERIEYALEHIGFPPTAEAAKRRAPIAEPLRKIATGCLCEQSTAQPP